MRRTDKVGTEAAFHGLDEYMKEVENYFDVRDLINPPENGDKKNATKRVVYLATDELNVLMEARAKLVFLYYKTD